MKSDLKKYKELFLGILCVLFAAFYLYQTTKIKPLIKTVFDAKVMPRFLGTALLVIGILQIVRGLKVLRTYAPASGEEKDMKNFLLMLLVIFAYIVALRPVGFIISTVVCLFLQMMLLAPKEKVSILKFGILSVVFTVAIYYIFRYGLQLVLPMGILG